MSKQRLKEQKKKDREREVKAKMLRRWTAKQAEDKKKQAWEDKMEAETNPNGNKKKPYRKGQENTVEMSEEAFKQSEIRAKLEHNLQILRALEQDYHNEQQAKAQLNQKLEAQGATDLKSKLDLLAEQNMQNISTVEETMDVSSTIGCPVKDS